MTDQSQREAPRKKSKRRRLRRHSDASESVHLLALCRFKHRHLQAAGVQLLNCSASSHERDRISRDRHKTEMQNVRSNQRGDRECSKAESGRYNNTIYKSALFSRPPWQVPSFAVAAQPRHPHPPGGHHSRLANGGAGAAFIFARYHLCHWTTFGSAAELRGPEVYPSGL